MQALEQVQSYGPKPEDPNPMSRPKKQSLKPKTLKLKESKPKPYTQKDS